MDDENFSRVLTDGGFGRNVGEYEGRNILIGTESGEGSEGFCVVVYWNDSETDESHQIATVDNSHGQPVHVDKYREGRKADREVIDSEVDTVYEAEQYAKDNWRRLASFHFSD